MTKTVFIIPSFKIKEKVIDTVGAGDVFNGAFATGISEGMSLEYALGFLQIKLLHYQ